MNEKLDASSVYAMQEEIKEAIRKLPSELAAKLPPPQAPAQAKPQEVRHHHTHTLDIRSNWILLSLAGLVLFVLLLAYVINRQRQTLSQYRDNDLKYRYIYMKGAAGGSNITDLERQFQYGDSIRLIRNRVEKHERLVREQAERLEHARRESEAAAKFQQAADEVKGKK
jgi:hypothetical protein